MIAKQLIIAIPGKIEDLLLSEAKLAGFENQNAAFLINLLKKHRQRREFVENTFASHIKFRGVNGNVMSLEDTKLDKIVGVKLVDNQPVVMDKKSFKTDISIYKFYCVTHPAFTAMKED